MKPKVIKTEAQYRATMARIDQIFDAEPGTPKGDELELLLLLVETYENEKFPIDPPDPIAALRFRMEQQGLKAKDLIPFIGSKSKVSEVLSGRRALSLTMIRKLVEGLGLPPEVALGRPEGHARKRQRRRALAG
jgi:HTH-type transcriptional regulator / antitoxin HigA